MFTATNLPTRAAAPRRGAHIIVLVAHATPLVSAGLVSTLRRLPSCDVRVWNNAQHQRNGIPQGLGVHVVFGDFALLTELRAGPAVSHTDTGAADRPKLVLVTTSEDVAERQFAMCSGVDGCLSIGCAEEDLFETVRRLGGEETASTALAETSARPRPGNSARGGLAPGALRRVRQHIDAQLAEKIELFELAAIAGLSACHFARAFKQSVGVPPHRYLMQRRVEVAADLIKGTDQTLSEISLAAGFSDQSHFTRMFASVTGETPGAFRHRHR